jgi:hypothetical protein
VDAFGAVSRDRRLGAYFRTLMGSIAHGSDGSRLFLIARAQLTINANGEEMRG